MKSWNMQIVNVVFPYIILCLMTGCGNHRGKQDCEESISVNHTAKHKKNDAGERDAICCIIDDLPPVHKYTFDYTDSVFPSRRRNVPIISGFDTDGKGRLYIAGGSPIRLVRYNGEEKEYDIEVSEATTNDAIMALVGDSVLLVEESMRRLAKIHKDGLGEVRHYALPIAPEDSVMGGIIENDTIRLALFDVSVEYDDHEGYLRNIHRCCISISSFDVTPSSSISKDPFDRLTPAAKEALQGYSLYGRYRSLLLYYRHDIEEISKGSVALVDNDGNLRAAASLIGIPHTPTLCGSHEVEGEFSSGNLYRLKGDRFFLSAFDQDDGTVSFLEYDLKPLYDAVGE